MSEFSLTGTNIYDDRSNEKGGVLISISSLRHHTESRFAPSGMNRSYMHIFKKWIAVFCRSPEKLTKWQNYQSRQPRYIEMRTPLPFFHASTFLFFFSSFSSYFPSPPSSSILASFDYPCVRLSSLPIRYHHSPFYHHHLLLTLISTSFFSLSSLHHPFLLLLFDFHYLSVSFSSYSSFSSSVRFLYFSSDYYSTDLQRPGI